MCLTSHPCQAHVLPLFPLESTNFLFRYVSAPVVHPNARKLKRFYPILSDIQLLEEDISLLSDDDLRARTFSFRQRLDNAGSSRTSVRFLMKFFRRPSLLFERLASVSGYASFDVQLIGSMVLHEGQIAEMKTGEARLLWLPYPAFDALTGRGVHVVTVNDYLARRDTEWMGQVPFLVYRGSHQQDMRPEERRRNYNCDITMPPTLSAVSTTCATTWPQTSARWCSGSSSSP